MLPIPVSCVVRRRRGLSFCAAGAVLVGCFALAFAAPRCAAQSNSPSATGKGSSASTPEPREEGPTLFLVGDSTMADKDRSKPNPEYGWGEALPDFFGPGIKIDNHARNGRSTKSFIDEGRWDAVVKALHPGDWVIIEFGHNDEKLDKPAVGAAAHGAYQENLRRFVRETRDHGATPILATPICRRKFDEQGHLVDTHGEYPDALRDVAKELSVPLLDMNKLTAPLIVGHGVEGSKRLFLWIDPGVYEWKKDGWHDDTHLSYYGSHRVAALAVQEMVRLDLGPVKWLKR